MLAAGASAAAALRARRQQGDALHHFRVLREAGITHTRVEGGARHVTLRREELEARFPGCQAILASAPSA